MKSAALLIEMNFTGQAEKGDIGSAGLMKGKRLSLAEYAEHAEKIKINSVQLR